MLSRLDVPARLRVVVKPVQVVSSGIGDLLVRAPWHAFRIHEEDADRPRREPLFIDVPSVSREHASVGWQSIGRLTDLGAVTGLSSMNSAWWHLPAATRTRSSSVGLSWCWWRQPSPPRRRDRRRQQAGPGPPQSEHGTELEFSSIEVLESLVVRGAVAQDPVELALMVQGSIDRLLDTAHRKAQPIGPDHAARIIAIAEIIAGWVEAGALDAWVRATAHRLGS
jgi:hypothetical protein